MKSTSLLLGLSLSLSACTQAPTRPAHDAPAAPSLPGATLYECTGGTAPERIEARYDAANETVTVLFDGSTYLLPRMPSGSGERYSNGSMTWWAKGNEALWQMDENLLLRDCQQMRPAE